MGHEDATTFALRKAEAAEESLRSAQAAAQVAARVHRSWESIYSDLRRGRIASALLESQKALAKRAESSVEPEDDALERLIGLLKREVDAAIPRLAHALPAAFSERNLRLDPSARYPHYSFHREFITADLDEAKLRATVKTRGGKPRRMPLDAEVVADAVLDADRRLFGRDMTHVDERSFVAAYALAVRRDHLQPGADVPLEAIRRELAGDERPAPADEFNVDLARVAAGSREPGRVRIVFSNTRDTSRGMLLHGMEDAGYIGYVRIEESA